MQAALSTLLRLFAPYLPFVTEEVWSWWKLGSVHRASWPTAEELSRIAAPDAGALASMTLAVEVLGEVRRQKSGAKRAMKAQIARAVIRDTEERITRFTSVQSDVCAAAGIQVLDIERADAFSLEVEFAEETPAVEPRA
jgi:valyl-tRNA synthetase